MTKHFTSRMHRATPAALAVALAGLATPSLADDPLNLLWDAEVQTVGFQGFEHIQDVAVDGTGNVYSVGRLTQPINPDLGEVNAGNYDGVLIKHDAAGNRVWYVYLQTSQRDRVEGVCVDNAGNIYVTGYTAGDLQGFNQGDNDNFVAKYDSNGNRIWIDQFGTRWDENAYAVAADANGNVYVTGSSWAGEIPGGLPGTSDLFLAKYDSNGNQQWLNYYGSAGYDNGRDIVVDAAGDVYIAGDTRGDFGGFPNPNPTSNHSMVAKFSSSGSLVWTNIFGASDGNGDLGSSIDVDNAGGVYVAGQTTGNIDFDFDNLGSGSDPYVGKFRTSNGSIEWIEQYGSNDGSNEAGTGVAVDDAGNVFLVGYITGSLYGPQTSNLRDGFIVKYDTLGNQLSTQQFGYESHWYTIPQAATAQGSGELYISGWASHQSIGASDIGHIWKFTTDAACTGDIADDFGVLGSDGQVSFGDFLALLGLVGPCPGGTPGCAGDIADDFGSVNGGDGMVSFGDFLALLGLVGPCDN